ncbi:MAG: TIGR03067 domain-containing protein [Chloracidobacterium sp.]|nr:TIGR03067 domain-containing protein [Chloracidobacterium sp.]
MKYIFFSAVTLTLVAFISTNAQITNSKPAKADSSEIEAMQGVWKPVEAVLGGNPLPQHVLDSITLKITGDKYEVTVEGENGDKGLARIDISATPKRIEISSTEGANQGKTFPAIYEFKSHDSFRICYDLSGAGYPAKFESAKDTLLYLVTYERQKK